MVLTTAFLGASVLRALLLGFGAIAWESETGFLLQIGRENAKIIAETRFLGFGAIAWESETGFLLQIGRENAKIFAETRLLGFTNYPQSISARFHGEK